MLTRKKWGRKRLPRISWSRSPVTPPRRFKPRRARSASPVLKLKAAAEGMLAGFRAKPARSRKPMRPVRPAKPQRAGRQSRQSRQPRSRLKLWLLLFLVLLILGAMGVSYVEQRLRPPIVHLASIRVKQIATESINKAITAQVAEGEHAQKLIDWKTDGAGKISGFMLNYAEHMRITSEAAEVIQSTLQQLHNRKESIPLGQALGSPLIASFGPKVPIKMEPQGAVKVELNTRQQNAGINMILVEVYIKIVTEVAVVVPFDMAPQVVDTEIPVSYLMVVGDVPMYYYDNQGNPVGAGSASAPGIAIPAPQGSGNQGEQANQSNQGTQGIQGEQRMPKERKEENVTPP